MAIVCIALLILYAVSCSMVKKNRAEVLYEEDLRLRRLEFEVRRAEAEKKLRASAEEERERSLVASARAALRITEQLSKKFDQ